jgi:hypothetical protein
VVEVWAETIGTAAASSTAADLMRVECILGMVLSESKSDICIAREKSVG